MGEQSHRGGGQGAVRDISPARVGCAVVQAATANFNPFGGETKLDSKNPERGPLLIIAGTDDNTVPLAITHATYKIQSKNPGVTEIAEIPGSGHSLVIDGSWQGVAEPALGFIQRFL